MSHLHAAREDLRSILPGFPEKALGDFATATRKSALLGSGEDGAKAAGRLGEPRVDIVGRLLVIGVDRIISQNRDIDPEWVVVDHTVPECRTETRPGRGARRIMFFFEIR